MIRSHSFDSTKCYATRIRQQLYRSSEIENNESVLDKKNSVFNAELAKQPSVSSSPFQFKEFHSLDNSPNADFLINSMDVMMGLDSIQKIKSNAVKAMNLQSGDNVLEIGCGHGEDAELIGSIVGNNGHVVATDLSTRMIEEAKKRSKQSNVEYLTADLDELQYPYNSFSGCHADRLLVSSANYKELFANILKFVKPGGVISFTDVDAISIIIQPYNKITKLILAQIHECFVNPSMGSKLPDLFSEYGLENIKIIPEHSMVRSYDTMSKIFQFENIISDAVKSKKITIEEGKQWINDMQTADKQGKFLYCITMFTVVGYKPKNTILF